MRLSEKDTQRALSVVEDRPRKAKKSPRQRRCGFCGLLYDLDELHPEIDEEGRQIGMICDSCI